MRGLRIFEHLKRYFDGAPASAFAPCSWCSPVAAHVSAGLCDPCKAEIAEAEAEDKAREALALAVEEAHEDARTIEDGRDIDQWRRDRRAAQYAKSAAHGPQGGR